MAGPGREGFLCGMGLEAGRGDVQEDWGTSQGTERAVTLGNACVARTPETGAGLGFLPCTKRGPSPPKAQGRHHRAAWALLLALTPTPLL